MNERNMLISYNDIYLSEDESNKYDGQKLNDEKLEEMKDRIKNSVLKSNFNRGISNIEKDFKPDEAVQKIIWGITAKTTGAQIISSSLFWGDVGRNSIIIVTNKRLYVAYANMIHEIIKIKWYYFNQIEFVKEITRRDRKTITIISKNKDTHEIYFFNNNYLDILNILTKEGVKIIKRKESLIKLIIRIVLWGILIATFGSLFIGFIFTWVIPH
ncbi:hypothetical protein [Clostridium fungisolvens]|uniref:Uncharacterized protein n=1 Tax=Clostridium fungisolvens TaxID=1604897 RepID=A0A6V8SGX2_9CLOT|nr:hypothetical protein [Clostridium fungisolvens]GFP75832.1 hypothetical protein bsdtw1_01924 [Clostridium fungisolvens]